MDLNLTVAIISLIVATISVGVAIIFGVPGYISAYYAKKDHDEKKQDSVIREDHIGETYSRAIDQLGSEKIVIRLGAISSLEMIAKKSDEYYWSIMENLTTFIRTNSRVEDWENKNEELKDPKSEQIDLKHKVRVDIQAIINVIGRRRSFFKAGEPKRLYLRQTNLRMISFADALPEGANLEGAWLDFSDLIGAYLAKAHLKKASFTGSNLNIAQLNGADLTEAHLDRAYFRHANLSGANLSEADLSAAHLEEANFGGANLKGAKNLTIDQLSKVKTLYKAELDEELLIPLRE